MSGSSISIHDVEKVSKKIGEHSDFCCLVIDVVDVKNNHYQLKLFSHDKNKLKFK